MTYEDTYAKAMRNHAASVKRRMVNGVQIGIPKKPKRPKCKAVEIFEQIKAKPSTVRSAADALNANIAFVSNKVNTMFDNGILGRERKAGVFHYYANDSQYLEGQRARFNIRDLLHAQNGESNVPAIAALAGISEITVKEYIHKLNKEGEIVLTIQHGKKRIFKDDLFSYEITWKTKPQNISKAILVEVRNAGSITTTELAKRLNIAWSTAKKEVQKMFNQGDVKRKRNYREYIYYVEGEE